MILEPNIIPNKLGVLVRRLLVLVVGGLVLAGCSSSSGGATAGRNAVDVVASTNVYGDIVREIGGSGVSVTSIIADPDQDPHSYEADARTQLALSRADLVVKNGGGYDDFVGRMLSSANRHPTTIDVVTLSGHKAVNGELNEHVWYDFAAMRKLTSTLVADLTRKNPADKALFARNGRTFDAKLTTLQATERRIKAAHAGAGVAITEPVPLYLLAACGLVNKTPAQFSEAIEEGEGVPVRVLDATLQLFSRKSVKLLAYNEQTSGPETRRVLDAAKANGIAVVPVTETLPAGKNYISWMAGNLAAVQKALA